MRSESSTGSHLPRGKQATPQDPDEQVIDEFMGNNPRVARLSELCDALRSRIKGLRQEMDQMSPSEARDRLSGRVEDARRQLAVLKQELAISQFVEESARVALHGDTQDIEDVEDEE